MTQPSRPPKVISKVSKILEQATGHVIHLDHVARFPEGKILGQWGAFDDPSFHASVEIQDGTVSLMIKDENRKRVGFTEFSASDLPEALPTNVRWVYEKHPKEDVA